ncbi:MAG: hypothetical protein A2X78_01890 [Gammaproteobacteria bacterium GWE2_37_16]|nr:MAG: hypothetical protein A2X78_01890 [Gammaproteobacteria bacterium GWE2_37_16]
MEEMTSDLFTRYFPNRCGFGKGQIQDSFGSESKEVDIIVFDRDSIPPVCHGIKNRNEKRVEGFFPVESLWYAIEVKKSLNNNELRDAVENMESVKNLRSHIKNPVRMLFAYSSNLIDSDMNIKKEFERYKKADSGWNKNPAIQVICIIGKGYLFVQFAKRNRDNKRVLLWKYIKDQTNYLEVACCLAGMINTITGQVFDPYLFDESTIQILEEIEL